MSLEAVSLRGLLEQPPPVHDWLVEGLLQTGELLLLVAPPKAQKSRITMQLLMQLSTGRGNLFGRYPVTTERVPTLYLDGENGLPETSRRAHAMAQALQAPSDVPFMVVPPSGLRLAEPGDLRRLLNVVDRTGARVVGLDPMIELAGGIDENDNIAQNRLIRSIINPLSERGVGTVITHHARKGRGPLGAVGGSADAARGASAVRALAHATAVVDPAAGGAYRVTVEGRAFERHQYRLSFDPGSGLLMAGEVESQSAQAETFTTLEREIVDHLDQFGPASQSEIRAGLGAPKSSLHDALQRLKRRGVVSVDVLGRVRLADELDPEDADQL